MVKSKYYTKNIILTDYVWTMVSNIFLWTIMTISSLFNFFYNMSTVWSIEMIMNVFVKKINIFFFLDILALMKEKVYLIT